MHIFPLFFLFLGPLLSQRDRAKHAKELKQRGMEEADVIVCTLNYSGNSQFDPFCPTLPNQPPFFDCLIVDEASQSLELDVFIPLRLGIRRVLLVGDPEQLPPTVISNNALNAKFGQSLMERLYSLFKSTNLIRMLNIVSAFTSRGYSSH
jgi:senataxin